MKKFIASVFVAVFFFAITVQGFALDVPRSENARTSNQASGGLGTASSSSSAADSYVP